MKLKSFSQIITRGVFYISFANLVFAATLLVLIKPALIESLSQGYLTNLADFVKNDARYTLLVQDQKTTDDYLQTIGKFPWLSHIALYDNNVNVLGSFGESNWLPLPEDFQTETNVKTLGTITHKLESIYSETDNSQLSTIGFLHLAVDGDSLIAKVNNAFYLLILALVIGSFFIWLLMRAFALKSTQSIRALNQNINSVQSDFATNTLLQIKADSIEIANVQNGINNLLKRISENHQDLEYRVQERTIELATALEVNRRAEAVRRSLIMNLSHDLKTPLTSNIAYLNHAIELLEESDLPNTDVLSVLAKSRHSSMILSEEIRKLLQYSTSTDESDSISINMFDVGVVVNSSLTNLNQLIASSNNKVLYHHSGAPLFITSQRLFTYVLDNLITNANSACKNGVITIDTEVTSEKTLLLNVHDTGIGIPEDQQERIFEKHFQGESSRHPGPRGMGIGLSLTKFWIDQLGGTIVVSSKPGQFTAFVVTIPESNEQTYSLL